MYIYKKRRISLGSFFREQIEISSLLSVSTVQIKKFVSKGTWVTLCSRICQTTLNNVLSFERVETHKCMLSTSGIRWILFDPFDLLYFTFFLPSAPWKVYIHISTQFWCTLSNCVTWEFKALFVNVESGVKRGRNCKWRCYRLSSRPLQSLNGGIFCPQQITKVWRGQLYNFLCSLKWLQFFRKLEWNPIL